MHFEAVRPQDGRPRAAIEAARRWVRDELSTADARKAAFASHAAAREAMDLAAIAAARAAGHAAASAHVPKHSVYAAAYALKAVAAAGGDAGAEHAWQVAQGPEHQERARSTDS